MTQSLYGLQVEFVKQYGHDMAISAPEGLRREELSEFQLRMLTANRIPRLLELKMEAKDGHCTLYYNVAGKRMLAQTLRMEPITMKQYYSLLLQVAEVLADSAMYMLQPGRFVLKEDFMFCGSGLDQLYFTYLPMERAENKSSVSADLQQLASRWIHRVSELQGMGFQELMRFLQEESFNLPELKLLLHRQLERLAGTADLPPPHAFTGRSGMNNGTGQQEEPIGFPNQSADGGKLMPHAVRHSERIETGYPPSRPAKGSLGREEANGASSTPPLTGPASFGFEAAAAFSAAEPAMPGGSGGLANAEAPRFRRLPVVLGMILGLSLLWKLYADRPDEQFLYICAGGSFVIVAVGVGLLRMKVSVSRDPLPDPRTISGQRYIPEPPDWPAAAPLASAGNRGSIGSDQFAVGDLAASGLASVDRTPLVEASSFLESTGLAGSNMRQSDALGASERKGGMPGGSAGFRSEAGLHGRTTMLRRVDATVVLSPSKAQGVRPGKQLETNREGRLETIPLSKTSFLIGRHGSEVDYVLDEAGVSRLHAEFIVEHEGAVVKDLGSSNGTRVNGELLVPYQGRPLCDGDKIMIVTTEFTYKA
ncbi:DUF6382 domain-containing protein [Paenibacillus puerhi]|uniref:DUF6382 domain-containing protein n=1 Tax=Paenibacillus puerhi TaxID=2692622 RepID=UPI00135C24E5|nr:DUF6382 domain-containing protein [Paenibacillus puerhi]